MPSRNTIKIDVDDSYYHVYARGASKQPIFMDHSDYAFFLGLFFRYLSEAQQVSPSGPYPHFRGEIELLSYCLMGNHFHLLLYQTEAGAMSDFMRSVMTSYSRYFNKRYKRTGSLFETRYKASRIDTPNYLEHISRYIHLNPRYWQRYPYSSIQAYVKGNEPEWLQPQKVLEIFADRQDYAKFVSDYESQKEMLDQLKYELADS